MFSGIRKTPANVFHPILRFYFSKIDSISEFIEGQVPPLKKFIHQVLLTPKEAIRYVLLQLPNGTQFLLESFGVLKVRNLLELINANYNLNTFLASYLLG